MNHARGFSLLETLAALALLALLLLGVFASVKTANHSAASGSHVVERLDEMRSAQQFLRLELTRTLALPWSLDQNRRTIAFTGAGRQMDFVSPPPGYLGRTGLQLLRLRLVPDKDKSGLRLEVAFAPIPSRRSSSIVPERPEVLLAGIRAGRFYYAGTDAQGRSTGWLAQWPYPSRLPAMVAVALDLDGSVSWPRLEVPLRMDVGATDLREATSRLTGTYAPY